MHKEPALTFDGALKILGRDDHKWLKRLDVLFGGLILGAGAAAVIAPPVAAGALTALWGMTEQKGEAVELIGKALDVLPERFRRTRGLERRELVLAAHSTIVVAAYFDAFRKTVGERLYQDLDFTNTEKVALAARSVGFLRASEIPAPRPAAGYAEVRESVEGWTSALHHAIVEFVRGLAVNDVVVVLLDQAEVVQSAQKRYEEYFLKLSATVPEFRVWVELGEHQQTRSSIVETRDELRAVLEEQGTALSRLERLISLGAIGRASSEPGTAALPEVARATAWRVNCAVLDEPIIPLADSRQYGRHLCFPSVLLGYINPCYRIAEAGISAYPASDEWWAERPQYDDLDLRLTALLSSASATQVPTVVLGHPGAGKSLFTKVLAARLPPEAYTVVRVALRHVKAHSPVYEQIQQALDRTTNRRVEWTQLVEQSLDTVRVVVLDGLDELLQQEHSRLYGYLLAVQEFQRTEASLGRPVAVVVTSRTVVTDRVDIPDGAPLIRLVPYQATFARSGSLGRVAWRSGPDP